jgi:hypothetical protein
MEMLLMTTWPSWIFFPLGKLRTPEAFQEAAYKKDDLLSENIK